MLYFVANRPTPVLNRKDFSVVFGGNDRTLPFDEKKLVRACEMIALPNTLFTIIQTHPPYILEVKTNEYLSNAPLFVDARFGTVTKTKPAERSKSLPSAKTILSHMRAAIGLPYVWGGNYSQGIPELLKLYPPQKALSPFEQSHWTFTGLDCSGLLYEATQGALPRNTQDLFFVGKVVPIANKSIDAIAKILKPLDLLLWKGHMVIVFDEKEVIESKHEWGGVTLTPLKKRLSLLIEADQKIPCDDPSVAKEDHSFFLVRRFIA